MGGHSRCVGVALVDQEENDVGSSLLSRTKHRPTLTSHAANPAKTNGLTYDLYMGARNGKNRWHLSTLHGSRYDYSYTWSPVVKLKMGAEALGVLVMSIMQRSDCLDFLVST